MKNPKKELPPEYFNSKGYPITTALCLRPEKPPPIISSFGPFDPKLRICAGWIALQYANGTVAQST